MVGDDLLVTNPVRVAKAIAEKSCNALLLKVRSCHTRWHHGDHTHTDTHADTYTHAHALTRTHTHNLLSTVRRGLEPQMAPVWSH